MVTSVNQNRHLYVANKYNATVTDETVVSGVSKGIIGGVKVIGTGKDAELIFKYKGADNTLKSDRIQLNNLNYAKAIPASDMRVNLKSVKVALDSSINSGNPKTGQDYILRITFRHWIGMSELDQYVKDAAVHVTAAMEADKKKFYKAMVSALNLAFSREIGASKDSNPYLAFGAGVSGNEDGIYITEKEQDWKLGTDAQERVLFDVQPTTIFIDNDDVIWGEVSDVPPTVEGDDEQQIPNPALNGVATSYGNGKKIADLEYFCMGERGDQYRNVGWPNVIATEYLVNPADEYYVLEIHHGFCDEGVNSYRSEKDITIVSATKSVINDLIGAINSAASLNIATLS